MKCHRLYDGDNLGMCDSLIVASLSCHSKEKQSEILTSNRKKPKMHFDAKLLMFEGRSASVIKTIKSNPISEIWSSVGPI